MNIRETWLYNEYRQIGTDYQDTAKVQEYETQMAKFRDFRQEAHEIMRHIRLAQDHVLLEIGTGTGHFAVEASRHCRQVYVIDVSQTMLDFVRERLSSLDIRNIVAERAGFLDYGPPEKPFDAVVSKFALHHLPDFWKMVAFQRIFAMLMPGGYFYLEDAVFSFPVEEYAQRLPQWVSFFRENTGEELALETEAHVREEFSTYDWILEEMLSRIGFEFEICKKDSYLAGYCCRKPEN